MDEVIQRSVHFIYFAVRGNTCPGFPRLDRDLLRNQNIEIAGFAQASKNCPKGQSHQLNTAGAICRKEAEFARVEPSALADIQTFHFISIITDEYEGSLTRKFLPVQAQTNAKKQVVLQNRKGGLGESYPLVEAFLLLVLLLLKQQDARIDAEAGIVDENAGVDFTDIHGHGAASDEIASCALHVLGNVEILCEMIQGPERKNAQRDGCAHELVRHGIYGAVTATGHDNLAIVFHGAGSQLGDVRAAGRQEDARRRAIFSKYSGEFLAQFRTPAATRRAIEDA